MSLAPHQSQMSDCKEAYRPEHSLNLWLMSLHACPFLKSLQVSVALLMTGAGVHKRGHPFTLQKQNGIHSPIQQTFLEHKHCLLQHKGQLDLMPPLQDLDEGTGPQAACRKTSRDLRRPFMGLLLSEQLKHVVKDSRLGLDLNHNSTTKDSALLDRFP